MAKNNKDVDIELLKKDVSTLQGHSVQIDTVLVQVKELLGGVTRMIAIHEEKHIHLDKAGADAKRSREALAKEVDDLREQLHKRISDMEKNLMVAIKEVGKDTQEQEKEQEARIKDLEIWKWKFAGALSVIVAVFNVVINWGSIVGFFS